MTAIPARLKFDTRPVAHPDAIVDCGNARFSVLTPRCVRMEWSREGRFEDRPSRVFWFREQPVPDFTVKRTRAGITLRTEALTIRYNGRGPFNKESLSLRLNGTASVRHPHETDFDNLLGTARTLDGVDGPCRLEHGLLSRHGITLIDDTTSLLFDETCWPQCRPQPADAYQDLYAFGYGKDYRACLRDFTALAGPIPQVPRWALGNWWSRYWAYTETQLSELMDEFRTRDIPLSVCVIDMDWHVVHNDHHGGWTGYTWNKDYFPHPKQLLTHLRRDLGLKVSLNLHPAEGVWPHEKAYTAMARHMGFDPRGGQPVRFDIADPRFADGYFKYLHHPHEALGIDFWWMDWQQGTKTKLHGLDPLFMLNHLHHLDSMRNGKQRPFVFSRWAGLGNHRYPIAFSGDTCVTWASLAFQPYFTATASNVGCTWWSHDIGGHFFGTEDPELYTRWVQLGVFSPINRLHTSKNRFQSRRPWDHGTGAYHISRKALQLRHALVPYLYSMNRLTHTQSLPLVQPMYWSHPDKEPAYHVPNQYTFGTELLAAPFTEPRDPDTRSSRRIVWLPEGDWVGFDDGIHYPGGRVHAVYGSLEDIPVFARAGAIIPLNGAPPSNDTSNPDQLTLRVFAGADNRFTLFEDDGESQAFGQGTCCTTDITLRGSCTRATLTVSPPRGDPAVLPARRHWQVHLFNVVPDTRVSVQVAGRSTAVRSRYDHRKGCLLCDLGPIATDATIVLSARGPRSGLLRNDRQLAQRIEQTLFRFNLHSEVKNHLFNSLQDHDFAPKALRDELAALRETQCRCLCEMLFEAGVQHENSHGAAAQEVLVWNNQRRRSCRVRGVAGHSQRQFDLPPGERFRAIPFGNQMWTDAIEFVHAGPWHCAMDYAGIHTQRIGTP